MPTIAIKGEIRSVVNPRGHRYEPPHVHIWISGEDKCRINLDTGDFMEDPPRGKRRAILAAYVTHLSAIGSAWDRYHVR